jgi:hypothetical protein
MPDDGMLSTALWVLGVAIGGWLVLSAAAASAAGGSLTLAAGLVIGGLLVYWTIKERSETDSTAETAERVGDRASDFFGGAVDWLSAVVLSSLFVAFTVGGQFLDVIDIALQMIYTAPVVSTLFGAGITFGLLDFLDRINPSQMEWYAMMVGLVVIGVLARRTLYGEVET